MINRRIPRHLICMILLAFVWMLPELTRAQSQPGSGSDAGEADGSAPAPTQLATPSEASGSAATANTTGQILWNGMQRALQLAEEGDKTILVFVYDPSCPFCQRMLNDVFPDPDVTKHVSSYMLPVQVDVTSMSTVRYFTHTFSQREFAEALGNEQVPTTYFMNSAGEIIGQQPGFIEPDLYATLIEFIGTGAYQNQSFDQYKSAQ